jgi:16S rRNA (cytidine1402-2'-O)-methyltransferase
MTPPQAAVGELIVCPTPIGNLDDVTLRVLGALREADVIACEHPRHTKVLLDRHGIDGRLVSFHEHNERQRAAELLARMRDGAVVALVADAGMPLVSDPGFELVRACLAAGIRLEVLPGPSAAVTALVASVLPVDRWRFVGFLPRSRRALETVLAGSEDTLVAFESPRRLAATLGLLAERDPDRPVAVCRELTKLHEEVRRGSARELAAHYRGSAPRGEVVLVCGGAPPGGPRRDEALAAVQELVEAGARPRAAATSVGRLSGLSANELYRELMRGR